MGPGRGFAGFGFRHGVFDAGEGVKKRGIGHQRNALAVGVHGFSHQVSGHVAHDQRGFAGELFGIIELLTHERGDDGVRVLEDFRSDYDFHAAAQFLARLVFAGVVVLNGGFGSVDSHVGALQAEAVGAHVLGRIAAHRAASLLAVERDE